MMKAIKNFMNKPITYGAYFKYCTVCASISLALCGWAYYQMSKLNNWVDTKRRREQSGRGRNLKDHALLSFYQTAKNSCSLMEEIAQMVERHFIVEVMGSRPILFFHFYFWRLNDYGGHYADPVEFSAPHHLAGHQ